MKISMSSMFYQTVIIDLEVFLWALAALRSTALVQMGKMGEMYEGRPPLSIAELGLRLNRIPLGTAVKP